MVMLLLLGEGHWGDPRGQQKGPEHLPPSSAWTPSTGTGGWCLLKTKAAMFSFPREMLRGKQLC